MGQQWCVVQGQIQSRTSIKKAVHRAERDMQRLMLARITVGIAMQRVTSADAEHADAQAEE